MTLPLGDVLVQPVVTEKSQSQTGKSAFVVHKDATKGDVKNAVKEFYGAEVEKVNISVLPEKDRVVGRGKVITKRSEIKKAVVTLKDGKTLEFNSFK